MFLNNNNLSVETVGTFSARSVLYFRKKVFITLLIPTKIRKDCGPNKLQGSFFWCHSSVNKQSLLGFHV